VIPAESPLLVKAGALIDGTDRPPLRKAWVLIQGGSIVSVGKPGSFPVPSQAAVLRAPGCTLLPGLIDAHVHLVASGIVGYTFPRPQPRGPEVYLRNLRAELLGGVTLVRDLHMSVSIAHRLEESLREDPTAGARFVYAGPVLTVPGGYRTGFDVPIGSAAEGRQWVEQLAREGAGAIKVAVTSRGLGKVGVSFTPIDAEVLQAIVDEAHRRGLPVAAHVAGATADDLRKAVEAGVDSLEHMPGESGPLDPPDLFYSTSGLLPDILRKGITIVPTLSVVAGEDFGPTVPDLLDDPALLLKLNPDQREILRENRRDFARSPDRQAIASAGKRRMALFLDEVRRLHQAGVRLGAGSDAGSGMTFHGNLFTEIQYLHEGGLAPLEAIQAATRGNADLLRVSRLQGTVEPGKRADLLLVRGDPLRDLAALRRVEKVIIAGRVVDVRGLLKEAVSKDRKKKRGSPSPS
jgi:imidazolonepropionase-like amidohydrolase